MYTISHCRGSVLQRVDKWFFERAWEIVQEGIFYEAPVTTIRQLSGFSKLLYQSYYRGTQRIAVCRNCGCATLQQNHGRKREFCSDACRAQWVSEGKD